MAADPAEPGCHPGRRPGRWGRRSGLALLLLVLRDLADGWLALGFGATRGRGSVRVSRVAFTGEGLTGIWAGLPGRTLADVIDDPPDGVSRAFAAWRKGDEHERSPLRNCTRYAMPVR